MIGFLKVLLPVIWLFSHTAVYAACDSFFLDALTSSDRYVIEDSSVYYCWGNGWISQRRIKALYEADAESFRELKYGYAKDKNSIFYEGQKKDYDVDSFFVLSNYYAKDKEGIYFQGQKVDYDPKTFKVIDEKHAIDANHLYVVLTKVAENGVLTYKITKRASEKYRKRFLKNTLLILN